MSWFKNIRIWRRIVISIQRQSVLINVQLGKHVHHLKSPHQISTTKYQTNRNNLAIIILRKIKDWEHSSKKTVSYACKNTGTQDREEGKELIHLQPCVRLWAISLNVSNNWLRLWHVHFADERQLVWNLGPWLPTE